MTREGHGPAIGSPNPPTPMGLLVEDLQRGVGAARAAIEAANAEVQRFWARLVGFNDSGADKFAQPSSSTPDSSCYLVSMNSLHL